MKSPKNIEMSDRGHDGGWRTARGGRRRAKGTTYNVSDFLKMTEKKIKAEKIEEEEVKTREEERSEASIGARTGVSDLVPMLNLTDEDNVCLLYTSPSPRDS